MRPNSHSVSVSQGKGLDLTQAMTSALMEAIEGFHAEEVNADWRASYREIAAGERTVGDPLTLCSTGRCFDANAPISWFEAFDLPQQEPCWVPAEIVHTDYTQPLDGYFLAGSHGLASGNHLVEARYGASPSTAARSQRFIHSPLGCTSHRLIKNAPTGWGWSPLSARAWPPA